VSGIKFSNIGFPAGATVVEPIISATVGGTLTRELLTVYTNRLAPGPIEIDLIASVGLVYTFINLNGNTLDIGVSAPGNTIRFGTLVKSFGDTLVSFTLGSSITLVCVTPNSWVATAAIGSWI